MKSYSGFIVRDGTTCSILSVNKVITWFLGQQVQLEDLPLVRFHGNV